MKEDEKEPQVPDTNNIGEEEVPEETADTVVVPGEEKTTPTGAYTKVDLTVTPVVKNVADIPHVTEDEDNKTQDVFSKTDAKFFSDMIWAIPPSIFGDYMTPNDAAVKNFGEQLFTYCERKGLNPYSYLFDELGLVLATGAICADLGVKYRKHKKELEEEEKKEEED